MSSIGSEENLSLFIPDEELTVTPLLNLEKLTPYPVTFTPLSLSSVDFSAITREAKNKEDVLGVGPFTKLASYLPTPCFMAPPASLDHPAFL